MAKKEPKSITVWLEPSETMRQEIISFDDLKAIGITIEQWNKSDRVEKRAMIQPLIDKKKNDLYWSVKAIDID
jgi:hypothetical protein